MVSEFDRGLNGVYLKGRMIPLFGSGGYLTNTNVVISVLLSLSRGESGITCLGLTL